MNSWGMGPITSEKKCIFILEFGSMNCLNEQSFFEVSEFSRKFVKKCTCIRVFFPRQTAAGCKSNDDQTEDSQKNRCGLDSLACLTEKSDGLRTRWRPNMHTHPPLCRPRSAKLLGTCKSLANLPFEMRTVDSSNFANFGETIH